MNFKVFIDEPDLLVERVLADGSTSHLVLYPTKEQAYIQEEDGSRLLVTHDRLVKFFRGVAALEGGPSWMPCVNVAQIESILKHETGMLLIRYNLPVPLPSYSSNLSLADIYAGQHGRQALIASMGMLVEASGGSLFEKGYMMSIPDLDGVRKAFSRDTAIRIARMSLKQGYGADRLMEELCKLLLDKRNGIKESPLRRFLLGRESFSESDLYRQGFEEYMVGSFFQLWKDTLDMQEQLRGRVWEPYPKALLSMHDSLAAKLAVEADRQTSVTFEAVVENLTTFERELGLYKMTVPKTVSEIRDEAVQQHNCVASYVSRMARGETEIWFLRLTESPDKSLVTVEYRDGQVVQAKRAFNRACTRQDWEALYTWAAWRAKAEAKNSADGQDDGCTKTGPVCA